MNALRAAWAEMTRGAWSPVRCGTALVLAGAALVWLFWPRRRR